MPTVIREEDSRSGFTPSIILRRMSTSAKAGAIVRDRSRDAHRHGDRRRNLRPRREASRATRRANMRKRLKTGMDEDSWQRLMITAKDRERYARARALGQARAQDPSAVVDARYDPDGDAIDFKFGGGGSMAIPRKIVPGWSERRSRKSNRSLYLQPGDALSWPSLDIDVHVPGLVERAFGTRLFAAATGRHGGRRRSKAKAAAAKANGAKGGRPRKRLTA